MRYKQHNGGHKIDFTELAGYYTKDEVLTGRLWTEIEKRYGETGRHYHTLTHINSLVKQLTAYKHKIADRHTLLFSVYYHDVVYNVLENNNEEESALMIRSGRSFGTSTQ